MNQVKKKTKPFSIPILFAPRERPHLLPVISLNLYHNTRLLPCTGPIGRIVSLPARTSPSLSHGKKYLGINCFGGQRSGT